MIAIPTMPVVCMRCGITYKHVPACEGAPADAYSSGYCPPCLEIKEREWYGTGGLLARLKAGKKENVCLM